jgi:hypothetical protein
VCVCCVRACVHRATRTCGDKRLLVQGIPLSVNLFTDGKKYAKSFLGGQVRRALSVVQSVQWLRAMSRVAPMRLCA